MNRNARPWRSSWSGGTASISKHGEGQHASKHLRASRQRQYEGLAKIKAEICDPRRGALAQSATSTQSRVPAEPSRAHRLALRGTLRCRYCRVLRLSGPRQIWSKPTQPSVVQPGKTEYQSE